MSELHQYRFSQLLREIDNLLHDDDVSTVALALIQIDGMAEINSRFGYLGGDKVLEECRQRIAGVVRKDDCLFDLTATTFAMLIRNPVHEGHAILGAEKIIQAVGESFSIGPERARLRARIGISRHPELADTAEDLVRQGEAALMHALGHAELYIVYTPDIDGQKRSANQPWFDVDEALQQGEIEMYFQPKVQLRTGRLVGAEALMRWQSPVAGVVPPGVFIPQVDDAQSIRALLWFALNGALRQASSWLGKIPEFSIAVNIAPANLEDPDLVEAIDGALSVWDFPAAQLTLEITENALMNNGGIVTMSRLQALGVRMSIDDFGTGFSSLGYLKNLPADELKIDKSFVQVMAGSETDRRIIGAILQLAEAVGLEVVAEGIETPEELQMLTAMGAAVGQGFHFSPALKAADFEREWVDRFVRGEAGLA